MEIYTIKWFNSESKKVETKEFSSFEDAIKWGKLNLENFNTDLIN